MGSTVAILTSSGVVISIFTFTMVFDLSHAGDVDKSIARVAHSRVSQTGEDTLSSSVKSGDSRYVQNTVAVAAGTEHLYLMTIESK